VIVANSSDPFNNGGVMPQEYMGCPSGSRIVFQTPPSADGNVAGWAGENVTLSRNNEFVIGGSETITVVSGIASDTRGRTWNAGTGQILSVDTATPLSLIESATVKMGITVETSTAIFKVDPLESYALGQEIAGTKVNGQQEIDCPLGSTASVEINATTRAKTSKCVKIWAGIDEIVEQNEATKSLQEQKTLVLTELKNFTEENPGKQKCSEIGSLKQLNGKTLVGSLCLNPVNGSRKAEYIEVFSEAGKAADPSEILIPRVLVVANSSTNVIRIESTSNQITAIASKSGEKPVTLKVATNTLGFKEVVIPNKLIGYKVDVVQSKKPVTSVKVGGATYFSNGDRVTQIGLSTFSSSGLRTTTSGSTSYSSSGTSATKLGSTTYYSSGVKSQKIGTTTYFSDGQIYQSLR
jgi:hypothetical protein